MCSSSWNGGGVVLLLLGLGSAGSGPAFPIIHICTGNLVLGGRFELSELNSWALLEKMVQHILELCQEMWRVSLCLPELKKSLLLGDMASPGWVLMFLLVWLKGTDPASEGEYCCEYILMPSVGSSEKGLGYASFCGTNRIYVAHSSGIPSCRAEIHGIYWLGR